MQLLQIVSVLLSRGQVSVSPVCKIFTKLASLGRFGLEVAISVAIYLCNLSPFYAIFFRGNSLTLRSHDQLEASYCQPSFPTLLTPNTKKLK